MTLITFATYGDTATVLTDSFCYTPGCRRTGHSTKTRSLVHLDAVVACQGDSGFGDVAYAYIADTSHETATFDELVSAAPATLRTVWASMDNAPKTDGLLFLIGWSSNTEAFAAFAFDAATDFNPLPIDGIFIIPTPTSFRPSDLELKRLEANDNDAQGLAELKAWRSHPAVPIPDSPQEWADLGILAWRERCLPFLRGKVMIGGGLYLTQLARGQQLTQKILDFDDIDETGELFRTAIAGTLHPQAQVAPCIVCGSGEAYMDCCLDLDLPCVCDSGKTIGDCCVLTPEERTTVTASARG